MTSSLGGRSINVRLTAREWVGVFVFILTSAVGFATVFAQAKNVEQQSRETAEDLSAFKARTEEKLDRLIEMVGVLNGRLSATRGGGK